MFKNSLNVIELATFGLQNDPFFLCVEFKYLNGRDLRASNSVLHL